MEDRQKNIEAIGQLLMRLIWLGHRRSAQLLTRFQLTVPQFLALVCLVRQGQGCQMGRLADEMHHTSPTMTGIIDRLVDAGLVERHSDSSDRRLVLVDLTDRGRELLEEVRLARQGQLNRALEELSDADVAQLKRLLALFLKGMQTETEGRTEKR